MGLGADAAATLITSLTDIPSARAELADAINALNKAAYDLDMHESSAQAKFVVDNAAAFAAFKASLTATPAPEVATLAAPSVETAPVDPVDPPPAKTTDLPNAPTP